MASQLFTTAMHYAQTGDLTSNGKHNAGLRIMVSNTARSYFEGKEGISVGLSPAAKEGLIVTGLNEQLTNAQFQALRNALNEARRRQSASHTV
ncbi:MAG: hypothetical protein K2X09_05885 [Rickettsiales bacterium]|nr:hypothetical protein [Rickettsiales bacterium]